MANHTLLKELQQKIDYQFKDENLLFTAVTHSSYANEHKLHKIHHNERLEFLGDAVLEIVSSDFLFKNFPSCLRADTGLLCKTDWPWKISDAWQR